MDEVRAEDVHSRSSLASFLQDRMAASYSRLLGRRGFRPEEGLLKTYCIEADVPASDSPSGFIQFLEGLAEKRSIRLSPTEDEDLYLMTDVRSSDAVDHYFLDVADQRFWVLYTLTVSSRADAFVQGRLWGERELDSAWFPIQFLELASSLGHLTGMGTHFDEMLPDGEPRDLNIRLQGNATSEVKEVLDRSDLRSIFSLSSIRVRRTQDEAWVNDWIYFSGKITSVGNSFSAHTAIVSTLFRDLYRRTIVDALENTYSLGFHTQDGISRFHGQPLIIKLERDLDPKEFAAAAFSGHPPFRLWGAPVATSSGVSVLATDMHSGGRVSFLMAPSQISVHLSSGACGNVVTRFLTLLQRHYDASAVIASIDGEPLIEVPSPS